MSFATKRQTVKDYLLPLDLTQSNTTNFTITKRTEARAEYGLFSWSTGIVTLHGIVLDGDDDNPLLVPPAPFPSRRLEVYGDSDTCAFGNESKRTGLESSPC